MFKFFSRNLRLINLKICWITLTIFMWGIYSELCWRRKKTFSISISKYILYVNTSIFFIIYDENLLNTHNQTYVYIFIPTTYRFSIWNLYNRRAIRTFILAIVLCVLTILNKQKGPKVIFLCRVWGGNDFRVIEKPIVRKFLFFHLKYKYILCLVRVHTFVDIFE